MPRENHAQLTSSQQLIVAQGEGKKLLTSTVSFGIQASVNDSDHGRVVRIFVCLS